jgi:hypothetical protein
MLVRLPGLTCGLTLHRNGLPFVPGKVRFWDWQKRWRISGMGVLRPATAIGDRLLSGMGDASLSFRLG